MSLHRHAVALAAIVIVTSLSLYAEERAEVAALQKELHAAETALYDLMRMIPAEFDASTQRLLLGRLATEAGLEITIDIPADEEVLQLGDGSPAPISLHRVNVSGKGSLGDLGRFLGYLDVLQTTLRPLESLLVEASEDGRDSFHARLVVPVYTPPEPPAAGSARQDIVTLLRTRLSKIDATRRLIDSLVLRSREGALQSASAAIAAVSELPGVRVTRLQAGDRLRLEGVIAGAATRERFMTRLEIEGLAVTRVVMPVQGACRPFRLDAGNRPHDAGIERAAAPDGYDPRAVALCDARPVPFRGKVIADGESGDGGTLTLRLRGMEIGHAFQVINELSGDDFVIDKDVVGLVDLDAENATTLSLASAMSEAGVTVHDGPLHRVARSDTRVAPSRTEDYTGEPVSITLTNASLRSLLCIFGSISGLAIEATPAVGGDVTLFASEIPWDAALDGVLWSAGLDRTIDGTRVLIDSREAIESHRKAAGADVCAPAGGIDRFQDYRPLPRELDIEDLTLVGLARKDDEWIAYAYGPMRRIVGLERGSSLHSSTVKSVGPNGVTFMDGTAKSVELRLDASGN